MSFYAPIVCPHNDLFLNATYATPRTAELLDSGANFTEFINKITDLGEGLGENLEAVEAELDRRGPELRKFINLISNTGTDPTTCILETARDAKQFVEADSVTDGEIRTRSQIREGLVNAKHTLQNICTDPNWVEDKLAAYRVHLNRVVRIAQKVTSFISECLGQDK